MQQINVGLIGFGMAGRIFHAPLIDYVEGLNLQVIRETKSENIKIISERYPDVKITNESWQVINDPAIDLIVIAVPNKHHFSIAKEALEAGKHVVVDKPFTVTSEEAEELIDLTEKNKKIISVYQNRRWDSDFLTVQKVLKSGKLGRLVEFESHYDRFRNTIRPNTWKEEGTPGTGLLYDLGSHLIDQVQVLFGLPTAITADIRTQRDNTLIPDNFELILHYPELKVTIKSGMLVKEPLPKYILLGTEGAFVKYGLDDQEADLNEAVKSLSDEDWGKEPEELWGTLNTIYNGEEYRGKVESEKGNYPAFYENIYNAIINDQELMVKPQQARNTIRIIELAMKSNDERRTVYFE